MLQGKIQLTCQPLSLISSRPFQLQQKMLEGKPLRQLPDLIGLIYGLCQQAQSSASQLLFGLSKPETTALPNEQVIRVELIKEHLVSVAGQVFPVLGVAGSDQLLAGIGLWVAKAKQGNDVSALRSQIEQKLTLLLGEQWRVLAQAVGVEDAITRLKSVAHDSAFLQALAQAKAEFPLAPLPTLTIGSVYQDSVIDELLARFLSEKWQLVTQPDINGQVMENSPMTRLEWQDQADLHPLWLRQLARVVDIAQQTMMLLGECDQSPLYHRVQKGQMGLSWVETARGRLFHLARWDEQGIAVDYAIIAPTEWNFHPQGILQKWLQEWQSSGMAETIFAKESKALSQLIDPCVPIVVSKGENNRA